MKKILYATGNQYKIQAMKERLTGEELKNRNSIFDVECVNFIKSII